MLISRFVSYTVQNWFLHFSCSHSNIPRDHLRSAMESNVYPFVVRSCKLLTVYSLSSKISRGNNSSMLGTLVPRSLFTLETSPFHSQSILFDIPIIEGKKKQVGKRCIRTFLTNNRRAPARSLFLVFFIFVSDF